MEWITILKTTERTKLPLGDFLQRFTQSERLAIRSSTVPEVQDFYEVLMTLDIVDTASDFVIDGVDILVVENILQVERAEQILKGVLNA